MKHTHTHTIVITTNHLSLFLFLRCVEVNNEDILNDLTNIFRYVCMYMLVLTSPALFQRGGVYKFEKERQPCSSVCVCVCMCVHVYMSHDYKYMYQSQKNAGS